MRIRRSIGIGLQGLVLFFLTGSLLFGQTTASLTGSVKDESGAVIPGATIRVTNNETGFSRAGSTDTAGLFTIGDLPLGDYQLMVQVPGFDTQVRRGIVLTVGSRPTVDFTLKVGAITQVVEVTEAAPILETTTSSVTSLVDQAKMRDLPLNARSYEQFATLQPTVYGFKNYAGVSNFGFVAKISAAGMRHGYNVFLLDGVDILDTTGRTPGSVAGMLLGVETLREYRVVTQGADAEYGRGIGAVIEAATRPGTNTLHGTAFEFLRNNVLDSRGIFDPGALPPYRRNQFGGVIGGPLKRDTAFFFGSYEAVREKRSISNVLFVPTPEAKNGIFPTISVPVNPIMRPYLALFPNPQQDIGGGLGAYTFEFPNTTREDFFSGRLDYHGSEKTTYFGRYSLADTLRVQPRSANVLPPWQSGLVSRDQTATLSVMRIISPNWVNDLRLGFVRYTPGDRGSLSGPDPELAFPGVQGAGTLRIGQGTYASNLPLAALGPLGRPFVTDTGNTYQFTNNVRFARGSSNLKMGVTVQRFQDNVEDFANSTGVYTATADYYFDSLEQFLLGKPYQFSGSLLGASYGIGGGRQWLYGAYVQEDYRILPNLTLNMGLRYEAASNYASAQSRFITLTGLFDTPKVGVKNMWAGRPCDRCLEPRLGWAWDIFSNGKTVIQSGFGVFHSQLVRLEAYHPGRRAITTNNAVTVNDPAFPSPLEPIPGARIRLSAVDGSGGVFIWGQQHKTPTSLQFNLSVAQAITADMGIKVGYVGNHAFHLVGAYQINSRTPTILPGGSKFYPVGAPFRNPQFGDIAYISTDYNSNYNGFYVALQRRLSRGLQSQVSYTFARATDDVSLGVQANVDIVTETPLIDEDRRRNHALSGFDTRHNFVTNFTYHFPSPTLSGFAGKWLDGWEMSGIVTLRSGTPLSPRVGFDRAGDGVSSQAQRPDLVKGPVPISQGNASQYFDPTVFALPAVGTYGNAGRNIITGPGEASFDVTLAKNTPLSDKLNLAFRAEAFNLFNRVNLGQPVQQIFDTRGGILPSAGRIRNTVISARQLQFGLKLSF